MKKLKVLMAGVFVLALGALPSIASAAPISCPSAVGGAVTHIYTVDTTPSVLDCVYGDGNLNGAGNDAFLDGLGINPDGGDPMFGGGWTSFSSTDGPNPLNITCTDDATNLDCVYGTTESGTFSFTGAPGFEYAFGIKDGSAPQWAVFLLPNGIFSGSWSISPQGAVSHLVVYDRVVQAPEPAGILLFGIGLAAVGYAARRRQRA